ncbi:MAG: gliding motility lipoprotein GldH [Bacteroidales bacterium]|nr:gliding motility lipoprotein GldH [Bacteroidales bacterium]
MNVRHIAPLLTILVLLSACHNNVYFSGSKALDEQGWPLDDTKTFLVNVTDTAQIYNFFVDLRVAETYPFANAFLFINTTFPDGSIAHDTLECPLAAVDGRWYGKQNGRYIDNRYYLRKQVRFPTTGDYLFTMAHAMRDSNATGFKNIGLRIEEAL